MAKWTFTSMGFTPVAVADTANFTNLGFMALQGGSPTQELKIYKVSMTGLATATAVTPLFLARDSTEGATLTGLSAGTESNGAKSPFTAALAAAQQAFTQSSTKPQRSSTLSRINMGFNAYGGAFVWQPWDGEDTFDIYGNTASLGEASLSCFTGGSPGLISATIEYEPK